MKGDTSTQGGGPGRPAGGAPGGAEGQFRDLAAAVPVGVFRCDAEGRCLYVNAHLSELTGRPPDVFKGEGWVGVLHPDDREGVLGRWRDAVARAVPFNDEFRLLGPDGGEVWVLSRALPERDPDGRITGYVGTALDITARRRAREAMEALAATSAADLEGFLRDSARQLARAYGARYASVGLLTGEAPARIRTQAFWLGERFAPNVTYDLAGTPCAEVLAGRLNLVPDRVAERYPEDPVLGDLGARSYFGAPLVGSDGRPLGVVNVLDVRPMTLLPNTEAILGSFARRIAAELERHRAVDRLKAEEWRLAQAQHMAALGHWEYDPATDLGTMSAEAWRIVGRPPRGPIPEDAYLQMVHPDDRPALLARLHAAFDPGRRVPLVAHYRIVRPNGEVRDIHDRAEVSFDEADRPMRVLGTMQDVTDQRRVQEAIEALAASSAVDLEAFLRNSTRHLARAYGARYALVGVLTDEAPRRLRTLAFWTGQRFADNRTIDLECTPCAEVAAGKLILVPDRVPERYPKDRLLAEMGVESYYGSPLIGAGGTPIGVVAALDARPMTPLPWAEAILGSFARRVAAELERHRAESVRAASERELAGILDHLQDTYFRVDSARRLARVSPSVRDLLGRKPEELAGGSVTDLFGDPGDLDRLLAALDAGGGRLKGHEVALRHADGRAVWVSINAHRVPGSNGEARGVEGTARDITEARRMARALAESEARLAETQRVAHLGSWEWDLAAGTHTWSDETFRVYGAPPSGGPVPHARFLDAIHPEDREAVETALRDTLENDLPLRVDHRIVRPDGTCRVVRQIGVARREGGVRLLGAAQDITDLARAEADRERFQALLLQAQKMEAVGLLAGGVAHDFNNLLTTISGFAELGLGRAAARDGPVRGDLSEIRRATERAAALTRQLLLFSRRQPMDFVLLDLGTRVAALLRMLERIIGEGVTIRADLGRGLWPVRADGASLDQLVTNLAINARDAMPRGGEIAITAANATLSERDARGHPEARAGRFVALSVTDTGQGMDGATLARVFEPFFTTKPAGRGTGLGMSVAHGIAGQHGGWIEARSRPGEGTTFRVYLPAADGVVLEASPPDEGPGAPRGEGLRVLVVEDEAALMAFAAQALRMHGYAVVTAASAAEAVATVERLEGAVDLVFSDVILPDGSGLELVTRLRALRPELRVLLSSGYPDAESGWEAVTRTGLPFIQKPYRLATLLEAVAQAVAAPRGA